MTEEAELSAPAVDDRLTPVDPGMNNPGTDGRL
jgi:hypothetical protein